MNAATRRVDDLIVVDPAPDDYAPLFFDERLQELPCRRLASGEAALRQLDASRATLWMVNMRLPDMTGVSFLALLRQRVRRCPVFLISDEHSLEDELAARSAGASAYLCKPVNGAWLRLCRDAVSRPAQRRGAPQSMS
jgi:DNA-binding response OmpR family regulator